MSRSRKKDPICGNRASDSEKRDKQLANRRLRRAVNSSDLVSKEVLSEMRELSNIASFDKDGKHWFDGCDDHNKLMRK